MATEIGGVGFTGQAVKVLEEPLSAVKKTTQEAWGYASAQDGDEFLTGFGALMGMLGTADGLSGFCYTQLTDTYQEVNGLLRFDRTNKVDPARIHRAVTSIWPEQSLTRHLRADQLAGSVADQ